MTDASVNEYTPDHEKEDAGDLLASSGGGPKTQIIAIYGKGGIGKSFTLANLSYMLAQLGKKVLLIGCDPKSDTTSLLFGGRACPTIIATASQKKEAGEEVTIGDVCFKRDGVFAMELGGPEVGRGCGGRGIIHGSMCGVSPDAMTFAEIQEIVRPRDSNPLFFFMLSAQRFLGLSLCSLC